MARTQLPLDRDAIKRVIPHREPFLLLDRVVELEPGVRAVAEKDVRADDWWFPGHFPDRPIMPGVMQVEALAQTAAVCAMAMPEFEGGMGLFAGIDEIRFKRIVVPGETLRLEAVMLKLHRAFGRAKVTASVNGEVSTEGEIMFVLQKEKK
ncbi:MAG: 3-hydroxyacyl-[acyl-carrier-protein] dehydratase FabZ [Chloroflexi bacterium 13_1_40CM_4_68_4]|nr:MAG: 3-hydroxyacyl-[acyl-carrier-protein] dehydratase FabZ [Chloroflexi bacterium 13_1_40CM_4_68_4]